MITWARLCKWLTRVYCIFAAVTMAFTVFGWILIDESRNGNAVTHQPYRFQRDVQYRTDAADLIVDGNRLYLLAQTPQVIKVYTTAGAYCYSIQLPNHVHRGSTVMYTDQGVLYATWHRGDFVFAFSDGELHGTYEDIEADTILATLNARDFHRTYDSEYGSYSIVGNNIMYTSITGEASVLVKDALNRTFFEQFGQLHAIAHVLTIIMMMKAVIGFRPLSRWT